MVLFHRCKSRQPEECNSSSVHLHLPVARPQRSKHHEAPPMPSALLLQPLLLHRAVRQCGQGSRCSRSASACQGAYRVIGAAPLVLDMTHTCGCSRTWLVE